MTPIGGGMNCREVWPFHQCASLKNKISSGENLLYDAIFHEAPEELHVVKCVIFFLKLKRKNQDLKKALPWLFKRTVTVFSAPWTELRIWPTGMNLKLFSTTG